MRFFEELKTAANDVNLELSEKQYEQFIKYMRLVQEWNEKINLTAITEDEEFIKNIRFKTSKPYYILSDCNSYLYCSRTGA